METKQLENNIVSYDNGSSSQLIKATPKKPKIKSKDKKLNLELIIEDDLEIDDALTNVLANKGTGAGGANTNYYGKKFEEKTNNEIRLLEQGYQKVLVNRDTKYSYYLYKNFADYKITFVSQNGLKVYIKNIYNIDLFRCPDEAYIIEYKNGKNKILILEKKEQRVEGSVETKLLTGPIFREEYEEALEGKFEVVYAFCVSQFLQNKIMSNEKKFIIFNKLMQKHNIAVLFGDDDNYFETFDIWFNNSL